MRNEATVLINELRAAMSVAPVKPSIIVTVDQLRILETAICNPDDLMQYGAPVPFSLIDKVAPDDPAPSTHTQAIGIALADALSERQRQLDAEGWIPQHDDQYRDNELIRAATCYLLGNAGNWPWSRNWWKPTDRRRDLIKATALIIAEIERLDRAIATTEDQTNG